MQSKTHSLIEQLVNVGSGFLISMFVWAFIVVPIWDLDTTFVDNLGIVIVFTVISVVRGYVWRRVFNWYTIKYVRNF